jgi:hypothetical protein
MTHEGHSYFRCKCGQEFISLEELNKHMFADITTPLDMSLEPSDMSLEITEPSDMSADNNTPQDSQ